MKHYVCIYETAWARKELPREREQATANIELAAELLNISTESLATSLRLLHTFTESLATSLRLLHTSGGTVYIPVDDGDNVLCPKCKARMIIVDKCLDV